MGSKSENLASNHLESNMFKWASKWTGFLLVGMATRGRRMMDVIFLVGWWLHERRTLREIVTYNIEFFD
jgi:hypothetical protein